MSSTLTIWSRDNLEDNTCRYYMHQPILRVCTSTKWRGLYEGPSPNFLRCARVQSFVAHTEFALACPQSVLMRMWEEILCTGYLWCLSNAFYNLYTKVAIGHRSLYGRNNVNPLIYITVFWLVHMCKQDIGMWKVIARTYQGSWSRRGELCYQLHKAIPMTQPSFWGYQIFMKKWELFISAKFEQNSENKESAY